MADENIPEGVSPAKEIAAKVNRVEQARSAAVDASPKGGEGEAHRAVDAAEDAIRTGLGSTAAELEAKRILTPKGDKSKEE